MTNLPLIEIAEMNRQIAACDSFQDDFSVADLDGSLAANDRKGLEHTPPIRLNGLLLVLVLEGESEVSIDYVSYKVSVNHFLTIMPTHTIQLNKVSPDFKGRLLVASMSFLDDCNPAKKSPSMAHYMQIKKNPCTELEPEETHLLDDYLLFMRGKIKLRTHVYQKEVIQNTFLGFILEVGNIFAGKKHIAPPTLSRKEELFEQFLEELFLHCREHHVVGYYADKLFITPQYLSLILKEMSGRSANKWIDDALIVEAKILLKAPKATVQQVADILHFSDQSTFGKFFKKHMGVSPMEYRKS